MPHTENTIESAANRPFFGKRLAIAMERSDHELESRRVSLEVPGGMFRVANLLVELRTEHGVDADEVDLDVNPMTREGFEAKRVERQAA